MTARRQEDPERIHAVLLQFRVLLRSIKSHYQSVERLAGLAGAQLWALSEIAANPGLSVGDLSRRLAVHLSTASNLARKMEVLGLVSRGRVGDDQRIVRLGVTAKGRAVLRRAPGPPVGLLQRALLDLPAARLVALHRELEVLMGHVTRFDSRTRAAPLSDLWRVPGSRAKVRDNGPVRR